MASGSRTKKPDPRFSSFTTDPRFRLPSRKHTHVQLDKRFAGLLHDEDFKRKGSKGVKIDRYGRRVDEDDNRDKTGAGKARKYAQDKTRIKQKRPLESMYELASGSSSPASNSEEDDNEDGIATEDKKHEAAGGVKKDGAAVETTRYDPARQGGFDTSSSSSSSESESESGDEDTDEQDEDEFGVIPAPTAVEDDGDAAPLEGGAAGGVPTGEVTRRLAAVNMDWDHMRASDIFVTAKSFCPPQGKLLRVTVYPSEFGRGRMEREQLEGPAPELFAQRQPADDDDDEDQEEQDAASDDENIKKKLLASATEESAEVDSKALRRYQMTRLRYYFAVLDCDSTTTAEALYEALDGREYLTTANFFDLRFIPDDVTFDDPVTDKPRDWCEAAPDGYKPNEFVTEALTHSKVRLTWDEEDRGRKEVAKRAFARGEMEDNDLQAYIGSGSSSDSESEVQDGEDNNNRQALISGIPVEMPVAGVSESNKDKKAAARKKLRAALGLPDSPPPPSSTDGKAGANGKSAKARPVVGNMQITFSAALSGDSTKDASSKGSVFENKPEDVQQETTRERYIRKEKERKARRKEKARAARLGDDNGDDDDEYGDGEVVTGDHDNKEEQLGNGGDTGFDDPFFDDPEAANATAKAAAKKAKRAAARAEEVASADRRARERADLELLMAEDEPETLLPGEVPGGGGTGRVRPRRVGFNMAEIKKAEKEAAKAASGKSKSKRNKLKRGETEDTPEATGAGEMIDVQDPRFARIYDSHDFAIDPSNPRFSGTKSMKALLEEGRRVRRQQAEDQDGDGGQHGGKRRQAQENRSASGSGRDGGDADVGGGGHVDVDSLVRKIKRRKVTA